MGDAAFWARKRLGSVSRYRVVPSDAGASRAEAARIHLDVRPHETLLGVYTNPPASTRKYVAVTSAAIAVGGDTGWRRMPYDALVAIRFCGEKRDWDVITLLAADGTTMAVEMAGGPGKPTTALSTFLLKVSPARREFDRAPVLAGQP